MNKIYQQGLTIIETVIVISILLVLISVVLPEFSQMRERQVLNNATSDALSLINKARSQTLASLDSSIYGVRFEADQIILFKGQEFFPSATDNEIITIINPASIVNVTLDSVSKDSGEIYFNRLNGLPSATGAIIVATPSFSKTVSISKMGIVSVE